MKSLGKAVSTAIIVTMLSGCSVAMASKKKGVSIQEVMGCQVKSCFAALRDTQIIDQQTDEMGMEVVSYKTLLPQGSTGRAVMHGLLDVATLGIWEVAGTPIEGHLNDDDYMVYSVKFDETGKTVELKMAGASAK